MKKPVRAIDMRRTATVLDFAVERGFVSLIGFRMGGRGLLGITFLRHFVDVWFDDATPEDGAWSGLDFGGRLDWTSGLSGVLRRVSALGTGGGIVRAVGVLTSS